MGVSASFGDVNEAFQIKGKMFQELNRQMLILKTYVCVFAYLAHLAL